MLEEQINSSRKKDKWRGFTAFTEMHKASWNLELSLNSLKIYFIKIIYIFMIKNFRKLKKCNCIDQLYIK